MLLSHFTELSKATEVHYFDHSYENLAKGYFQKCHFLDHTNVPQNELALHIINMAFTECEIERIFNRLKNNKSPGCDNIPSEFIKGCSRLILLDLCNLSNYMIERREFPEIWAEGIRSAIYKSGVELDPANYRGITVLPVFPKYFKWLFMTD